MTGSAWTVGEARAWLQAQRIPGDPDVVYFLMWPGWESELPGNRWHFARQWARRRRVVLVQPMPDEARPGSRVRPEKRIQNCEILYVPGSEHMEASPALALAQAAAILEHTQMRGYERPLLWLYNPMFAGAYAAVPAVARILHATENYFDDSAWFHGVGGASFQSQLRLAYSISDALIAVSDGLARAIEDSTGIAADVVTNGCDFQLYSSGSPDADLSRVAAPFQRVAIYAGNISRKVDLELMIEASARYPTTLFALYGPRVSLGERDQAAWKELVMKQNVHYGGAVELARLPDLYAAADVGVIPYRQHPLFSENAFPLKLFEMGASGLPVVTTPMNSITEIPTAFLVADSTETFLDQLGERSRELLTAAQREELLRVSAENDYDRKFDQVLAVLAGSVSGIRPPQTRLDEAVSTMGVSAWLNVCRRAGPRAGMVGRALRAARRRTPEPVRRLLPGSLRRAVRRAAG
jgi:glycosyltransferase involved in cell wall biosynthesis